MTEWIKKKKHFLTQKAKLKQKDKVRAQPHTVAQCVHICKEAIGRGTKGS